MFISVDVFTDRIEGVNLPLSPILKVIKVDDSFNLTKTLDILHTHIPYIHKLNNEGNPLYKDNIVDELTFDEVYYKDGLKPVEFKEEEVCNVWVDDNNVEHSEIVTIQVPTSFEKLEPVMVENIVTKTVSIKENPRDFTLSEVLIKKYTDLLNSSQKDFILADIFLNEDDVDFENPRHSANTGKMILELLPLGEVQTKSISLITSSKSFSVLDLEVMDGVEMYINDVKFTDGEVTLLEEVSSCVIKFVNTTDKPKLVTSYAIGY